MGKPGNSKSVGSPVSYGADFFRPEVISDIRQEISTERNDLLKQKEVVKNNYNNEIEKKRETHGSGGSVTGYYSYASEPYWSHRLESKEYLKIKEDYENNTRNIENKIRKLSYTESALNWIEKVGFDGAAEVHDMAPGEFFQNVIHKSFTS